MRDLRYCRGYRKSIGCWDYSEIAGEESPGSVAIARLTEVDISAGGVGFLHAGLKRTMCW
ncbi:MAG: hypothetical protein MRJ92_05860 [Nitrospira sp.]|nr:hypothetical protein [Nitrospira sp.]